VIATGGSAVYSESAMEHLKTLGAIVFLDVDLPSLKARIRDYETRGLAKRPDQTLEDLFNERWNLYRKYAELTVVGSGFTQEGVCLSIVEELNARGLVAWP
ncbi:MAG: shikimate kinase, partial [Acidobacteriota bacterium]